MKTVKELELDLVVKEALIQQLKYKNEMLSEQIASLYEDKLDKIRDYIIKILNNNYEIDKTKLLEIKEIIEDGEIYES